MKYKLNKSIVFIVLFFTFVNYVNASIYSDSYRVTNLDEVIEQNNNKFMDEYFEKIYRYDFIVFKNNKMSKESKEYLSTIMNDIDELQKEGKEFEVTLIGHTNKLHETENEKRVRSKTYATTIQNWFKPSYDENASKQLSKEYVQNVYQEIKDKNISQSKMHFEYRGDLDALYTDATKEGRDLANGVFLTIYVHKEIEKDSDQDGVIDKYDRCPGTPIGAKVDAFGCPLDSDRDGVFDYEDECPDTPFGVEVDKRGCPIDSDGDGVPDYRDACPGTPIGVNVDSNGCPLKSTLRLNFAFNSDKISQDSYSEIQRFADFLKENEAYKVQITGHTDSIGSAEINMDLSQRRAKMTKEALVQEGVDASRLTTRGRGKLEPIESNFTAEGRRTNRRIEIELFLD